MERFRSTSSGLCLLAALCACSGGTEKATGGGGGSLHLSLEPKTQFSDDDIRHFLVRTHFGVNNAELASVKAKGLPAYVDEMLVFPPLGSSAFEQAAEALLYNPSAPPGLENGGYPYPEQVVKWWLRLMEENPNPFQEVMAMFWHEHFSVSSANLPLGTRHWMRNHVDLLRSSSTANLRQLLVDVARDAAMLQWLDNVKNTRLAPNENFAREFWELYTLGVDNGYTQEDIVEAARAFTGYLAIAGPNGQSFIQFSIYSHDPGTKTFLGESIHGQNAADDFEGVVDITLRQRPVAEFICTKLLEHFCYLSPPQSVVDRLADLLRKSNWELRPVLATLFKSEAFYSPLARTGIIKSPVEHTIGFIRSTGMRIQLNQLADTLFVLGQTPSMPPTVEGWPGGEFWLGAQGIVERANFLASAISNRTYQASIGFNLESLLPPPGQRTAEGVVDWLAALLRVSLSASDRNDYVQYLNSAVNGDGTVVPSPWTGSSQQLDERLRGLLYLLGQHPTYLIR